MARLLIAMLVSICVLPALADSCRDRARKGGKMETVAAQQVSFDAKIAQATEDVLTVEYSLVNHAAADIYVMDTLPAWDPDAKKVVPVDRPYICYRGGGVAYVLKGTPPLPVDRVVTQRAFGLGTKVAPGQKLARKLQLRLPLREQSIYHTPLKDEDYAVVDVAKLVLAVQILRANLPDFKAEPSPLGAELFRVGTKATMKDSDVLSHELYLPPRTKLWKRNDKFPRM